jgi:predicted amidophosphoribosyltransferase
VRRTEASPGAEIWDDARIVLCGGCGAENRDGARFCGRCGAQLEIVSVCPGCGRENPPGQAFCDECGRHLHGPESAEQGAEPARHVSRPSGADRTIEVPEHLAEKIRDAGTELDGERKQVTVLFAN